MVEGLALYKYGRKMLILKLGVKFIMSLLFAFLDALLSSPSSSKPTKKNPFNDDVSWEEECFGCGEHFEDCSCEDCDDEDCEAW